VVYDLQEPECKIPAIQWEDTMTRGAILSIAVALAATVGAIPATAAAHVWTDDHVQLEEEGTATQAFEGFFQVKTPSSGSMGCQVTIQVEASAPSGGVITSFKPTTDTCTGTDQFASCLVTADSSNISDIWLVDVSSTPATITPALFFGTIGFQWVLSGCKISSLTQSFSSLSMTPTLDGNGTITQFTLSGTSTSFLESTGTFVPERGKTLGLQ